MAPRKRLNDFEKGQTIAIDHVNMSLIDIADIDIKHRDPSAIQRFLKRCTKNVAKEKPQNESKLAAVTKKRLLRAASNGLMKARDLNCYLTLPVTIRRVQQILHDIPHLKYREIQNGPTLTPQHHISREKWARRFITRGNLFWVKVIFRMKNNSTRTAQMV